jgi:hypothetical protein
MPLIVLLRAVNFISEVAPFQIVFKHRAIDLVDLSYINHREKERCWPPVLAAGAGRPVLAA